MFTVNFVMGILVSGIVCTTLGIGGEFLFRYGERNGLVER